MHSGTVKLLRLTSNASPSTTQPPNVLYMNVVLCVPALLILDGRLWNGMVWNEMDNSVCIISFSLTLSVQMNDTLYRIWNCPSLSSFAQSIPIDSIITYTCLMGKWLRPQTRDMTQGQKAQIKSLYPQFHWLCYCVSNQPDSGQIYPPVYPSVGVVLLLYRPSCCQPLSALALVTLWQSANNIYLKKKSEWLVHFVVSLTCWPQWL